MARRYNRTRTKRDYSKAYRPLSMPSSALDLIPKEQRDKVIAAQEVKQKQAKQ
jgi:intergrase/recombinase